MEKSYHIYIYLVYTLPHGTPTWDNFRGDETRNHMNPVRWMEEILHQLIGSLSHYLQGFNMFQPSNVMQDFATIRSIITVH